MSKFKIGDKARILGKTRSCPICDMENHPIYPTKVGDIVTIKEVKDFVNAGKNKFANDWFSFNECDLELIEKNNLINNKNNMNIFEILKNNKIQEPEKTLLEAGFIEENKDNCGVYTFSDEGWTLVEQVLLENKEITDKLIEFAKTKIDFNKKQQDEENNKK